MFGFWNVFYSFHDDKEKILNFSCFIWSSLSPYSLVLLCGPVHFTQKKIACNYLICFFLPIGNNPMQTIWNVMRFLFKSISYSNIDFQKKKYKHTHKSHIKMTQKARNTATTTYRIAPQLLLYLLLLLFIIMWLTDSVEQAYNVYTQWMYYLINQLIHCDVQRYGHVIGIIAAYIYTFFFLLSPKSLAQ